MSADFIVAIGTILLALAAFSQIEESKRQIENSIEQLRFLREQTDLLRKQVEAQEASRMPKITVDFPVVRMDGAIVTLMNNSMYEVYWRVGCIVRWPDGASEPASISTGDCYAYIEPVHRSGDKESTRWKIEPGQELHLKLKEMSTLANKLFSEPDRDEWMLALVIELAYPLSSTGEARCVYKLRLLRSKSEAHLSGFIVTKIPERPTCAPV